ncbi:MAG: asparagine synthase (glutamine-hydrolyzing) [Christensenellaceae bacterium]|jgi:asparagine synthase (glutamine-hydrolysing)|nr:asparagine synthase (glutamine-hydrolyzing) [Christensenellaceae bacterium]
MCGIAGKVSFLGEAFVTREEERESVLKSLFNRGPDAGGEEVYRSATLLHRRLSVVDIENGKQPMTRTRGDETYTIVYNGELYNTNDVRSVLISLGYCFKGHSDTEVLLAAYMEWKENCLSRLNGIFAFAVWEEHSQRLFCARDRIGVKPFFYYETAQGIAFASTINALLKFNDAPHKFSEAGILDMLFVAPGRTPGTTPVTKVKELLPGEYLYFSENGLQKHRYWEIKAADLKMNEVLATEYCRYIIEDSIKRQLVSDVPLACMLSGGLDSSIISYIAAREGKVYGKSLDTFSVDYEGNDKNYVPNPFQPSADNDFIKIMSDYIGSTHHTSVLATQDVFDSMFDATVARSLPGMADIDSSLLLFCREIKKTHTVALSGECADELFGGYPWYHNKEILDTQAFPWSNSVALRKTLFPDFACLADDYVQSRYDDTVKSTDFLPSDSAEDKRYREMFMLNFSWFMQTLLDRKDRMSMYSSLEVRVPFADYRICEFAYNLPWALKSKNGREKGIVRQAFKGLLPDSIIERKKSPYPKTFDPLFYNRAVKGVKDILANPNSFIGGLINKTALMSLLTRAEQTPWYGQLMRTPQIFAFLIQLENSYKLL